MEAILRLARAIEQQDLGEIIRVSEDFDPLASDEALTFVEQVQVRIDAAEWLAEHNAVSDSIRIYASLRQQLEASPSPDIMTIAQVCDRWAELVLLHGNPEEAAELWDYSIRLTLPIEGENSDAIHWRIARCADAFEQAGESVAADALRYQLLQWRRLSEAEAYDPTRGKKYSVQDLETPDRQFELVKVHFGTHRNRTGRSTPYNFFGGKRDLPLTYGTAEVSVPKKRELGSLPVPAPWMSERRADPARYFVIKSIRVAEGRDQFLEDVADSVSTAEHKEALVFIHGYNTSFADAVLRTAQLATDLEIEGAAILYSWPSRASPLSYLMDRNEAADPLVRELRDLLDEVVSRTEAQRIFLIAHSMGAEFLLKALEGFSPQSNGMTLAPRFSEIIFAAPDVDAMDFESRLPRVRPLSARVTVYSSELDRALKFSEKVHGEPRAGSSAYKLARLDVDSIDTSNARSDVVGHNDYATSTLDDLRGVVWLSLEPRRRSVLREQKTPSGVYWIFHGGTPTSEGVIVFRQALIWARRLGTIQKALTTILEVLRTLVNNPARTDQLAEFTALKTELELIGPDKDGVAK